MGLPRDYEGLLGLLVLVKSYYFPGIARKLLTKLLRRTLLNILKSEFLEPWDFVGNACEFLCQDFP